MTPVAPWRHDRPVRNLNPGDLRPRSTAPAWPAQSGVDHGDGGPFAIFPTAADGWAALGLWCLDARYVRGLRTAVEMVSVFAPPAENDTASYAAGVAQRIGADVLDLTHPATLSGLCRAIAHWEESHAVWAESQIVAGLKLCAARWPAFRIARMHPVLAEPSTVETVQIQDDPTKGQPA